jgi:hypothetical protein
MKDDVARFEMQIVCTLAVRGSYEVLSAAMRPH